MFAGLCASDGIRTCLASPPLPDLAVNMESEPRPATVPVRGGRPVMRWPTVVIPAILFVLFALTLGYWVKNAPLNADEGFYLAAARATLKGQLPYLDYGFTQGPFLPLIDAPLVALVPPTLAAIRWISAGWTLLGLIVAYGLLRGCRGLAVPVLCCLLLLSSPMALDYLTIGKTYSLAQLLLLLTAVGLVLPWSWRVRLLWLAFFGVLTVGTRLTLGPVVALLWAGLGWQHRREVNWLWMLLVPTVVALCLLGPFCLPDPPRFFFWNLGFHLARRTTYDTGIHPPGFWLHVWKFAPAIWVAAVPVAGFAWKVRATDTPGAIIYFAALAGLLINFFTAGVYPEYVTPFLLLLLVGIGRVTQQAVPQKWPLCTAGLALLGLGWFAAEWPVLGRSPPQDQAGEAARFLAKHTKPSDEVLAAMPEIALEARRPLLMNLVLGKFGVTDVIDAIPPGTAARFRLATYDQIVDAVTTRRPGAVVLSTSTVWNFILSVPSMRTPIPGPAWWRDRKTGPARFRWWLGCNYYIAYSGDTYVILLPRSQPLSVPPDDFPDF